MQEEYNSFYQDECLKCLILMDRKSALFLEYYTNGVRDESQDEVSYCKHIKVTEMIKVQNWTGKNI